MREVFGIVGKNSVDLCFQECVQDSFGLVFEIGKLGRRDISDDIKQVREPREDFIVEFSSQLQQLLIDFIQNGVGRVFELSDLGHKQRLEALHGGETGDGVSHMAPDGHLDEVIIVLS